MPDYYRAFMRVFKDAKTGQVVLRFHKTDIVKVSQSGEVTLNTGGYLTATTQMAMNDALGFIEYKVRSYHHDAYSGSGSAWEVQGPGGSQRYADNMTLPAGPSPQAAKARYLTLLPAKITWQPGGAPGSGTAKDVHIGLVSITNTQKAKGKPLLRVVSGATGYTFELGSELDRDALVEAYTKAKEQLLAPTPSASNTGGAQGSRSAAGAAAAPGVSGGSGGAAAVSSLVRQWEGRLPTPAQKRDMMKEDSELAERYNTLVAAAGVLAEDEFWAGVLEEQAKASQGGGRQAGAEGDGAAGKTGRAATGVASLSLMTQGPVQRKGLSNAMFQVPKRDMMKEDSELAEHYNTLVAAAGVLAEDEFWAGVLEEQAKASQGGTRQTGAEGDGAAGKTGKAAIGVASLSLMTQGPVQRKGLSNAMFQVPVEQDGRSVSMRFTLTPDLIALVFAEKPHVKRAYERSVPHNMSEKEFWTRYLRHEMSKEERRKRLLGNDSERL
ncbi:BSD domain-containing protein, partial [Haematococcus lacustris]